MAGNRASYLVSNKHVSVSMYTTNIVLDEVTDFLTEYSFLELAASIAEQFGSNTIVPCQHGLPVMYDESGRADRTDTRFSKIFKQVSELAMRQLRKRCVIFLS